MPPLTWKNVSAPSFAAVNALRNSAAEQFQKAGDSFSNRISDYGDYREGKNTDQLKAQLSGIQGIDNFAQQRQAIMDQWAGKNVDLGAGVEAGDAQLKLLQGNQTFANTQETFADEQLLNDQKLAEGDFTAEHRLDQYNQQKQLATAQIGVAEATAAEKQRAYNLSINPVYQEKVRLAEKKLLDDAAIREQTTNRLKEENKKGKGIFASDAYKRLREGVQARALSFYTDAEAQSRFDRIIGQYADKLDEDVLIKIASSHSEQSGPINWKALESALKSKVGELPKSDNTTEETVEDTNARLRRERGETLLKMTGGGLL